MNVPLYDATGVHIYRELMHRENRCAADWHLNYGPEALQKKPDPKKMENLGLFSKIASVPMPLDVQLRELRKERDAQAVAVDIYEKKSFPKSAGVPVSQASVDIWGAKAWHSEPEKEHGAPATHVPFQPPETRWSKRAWDVDGIQFVRETLKPAHVRSRLLREQQ